MVTFNYTPKAEPIEPIKEYAFNFSFTRPDEDNASVYEVGFNVRARTQPEAEAKLRRMNDHLTILSVSLFTVRDTYQE